MANYMAEVAKMLGVELGEEFEISSNGKVVVKLTENGLKIVTILGKLIDNAEHVCLTRLLTGSYEIKRKPWKPKSGDTYYLVLHDGVVDIATCDEDSMAFTLAVYKLGNCYRTPEEAIANRDKWLSFYASDEVLEV